MKFEGAIPCGPGLGFVKQWMLLTAFPVILGFEFICLWVHQILMPLRLTL